MAELHPIPSPGTTVASLLENPARQQGPDAILVVAPQGRLLPGAGGRIGEAGDAAAGYTSNSPFLIWCVLGEINHPDRLELAEKAFDRAFHLATERGCDSVGVVVERRRVALLEVDELTDIVFRVFNRTEGSEKLRSLHFLPTEHFRLG